MSSKPIERKVHINSRNKQMSLTIPKKIMPTPLPKLKSDEELTVKNLKFEFSKRKKK